VTYDWTFAYWKTSFVQSPSPKVILQFHNGKYRPDLEMMRKAAPTTSELNRMAKKFKHKFGSPENNDPENTWSAPPELGGKMLDLIYSGNTKSAWKLLDLSWPAGKSGKNEFLREFKKLLATSQYYAAITQPSFQREK
jgi:hypothetical protein